MRHLILTLALMGFALPVTAETARVAVAGNFMEAAEVLAAEFEAVGDHELALSAGSTGSLFAILQRGGPYEVFLSADQARPLALEELGLTVPGRRFTYAQGRLVLWSRDAGLIGAEPEAQLRSGALAPLAIADPVQAPYGAAAIEVLQALNAYEANQAGIVWGQNVGQTFAFVATGNAKAGFIARAAVQSPRNPYQGSGWDVPSDLNTPILQDAVLMKRGAGNAAAEGFLDYLRSDQARATLTRFGYEAGE